MLTSPSTLEAIAIEGPDAFYHGKIGNHLHLSPPNNNQLTPLQPNPSSTQPNPPTASSPSPT